MVRHRTSPQNTPECRVPQCHLSASFRDCSVIITGAEQNSSTCVYKKPGRQILKEAYSDLELISKLRRPNPLRYHSAQSQARGAEQLPDTDHTSYSQVFPPRDPEGRRDCWLFLSPWSRWFYHGGAEKTPHVPPDRAPPNDRTL